MKRNLLLEKIFRKFSFLLLLFIYGGIAFGQVYDVTIGAGTAKQRFPLGNYYGYERTAAIYTAAEIGQKGIISKLQWYAETAGTSRPIKIYLKETTASTKTAQTWATAIAGATLVYNASMTPVVGWNTFNISEFYFSGGSNNLEILVEGNYGGNGGTGSAGNNVRYSTVTNAVEYWQKDGSEPTGNGTVISNRPNVIITITANVCLSSGNESTLTTAITPSTANQQVTSTTGVGPGSRKIYSGFTTCHQYNLWMNHQGGPTNCVSGRWLDASGNPITGSEWFSINYGNGGPGTYTNVFPPMNATQLEIKTGRSSWAATSALLNYKYTDGANGDPTAWGNGAGSTNQWNCYGYDNPSGYNSGFSLTSPTSNYAGYYMHTQTSATDYGFDSESRWDSGKNPSKATANGWAGCPLRDDYFTTRYKRQNFPCGIYRITMTKWDDACKVFVNGVEKPFANNGNWYGAAPNNGAQQIVGTFFLDASATVEIITPEGSGGAVTAVKIEKVSDGKSTPPLITNLSSISNNCGGNSITLSVNDKVGTGGEIDHSGWTVGSGGLSGYSANGLASENQRINDFDPWGNPAVVWEARPSGDGNADGGWNGVNVPIDNTKKYRYSVWIRRTVQGTNGNAYFGLQSNTGGATNLAGTHDGNPYFWYSPSPAGVELPTNEWVLMVGYVHPVGYSGATEATSGRYNQLGVKYGGIIGDYKWTPGTTVASLRTYLYYAPAGDARQQWIYPRIDIVDGTEPSIAQLLNGFDAGGRDGLADGANWVWHTGSCTGTSPGSGKTISVAPTATTNYFVRAEGGQCASNTTCIDATVIVNPKVANPTITPSGPTTFCNGDNVDLTANDIYYSGKSMNFSGSNYVNLGNPASLQITKDQTIEMWIKPTDYTTGRQNPYAKAYAGEGTITQEPGGTLNYYYGIDGNDGTNYQSFGSSTTINNGQWNHIAIVRDFTNNKLSWYINGVLTNTLTPTYSYATAGAQPVRIGSGYAGGYNGEIDEVRVWNIARTQAQIQANMNVPIQPGTAGLAGYWRFDESSGAPLDASGYSNSGALVSAPTRVTPSEAMPVPDASYGWSPATGLSAATGKTVTASPSATTTYTLTLPDPLTCGDGTKTQKITITADMTATTVPAKSVCVNTALTSYTHTTARATGIVDDGIAGANGLPPGVSATWASNKITISGTPTSDGTYNYSIPLTGGCGTVNATGTITVTATNTVSAASSTPTLCQNTALTAITHTTTGATGIGTPTGLPTGVTASFASNEVTISGTPSVSGVFNYSIPLTGGCGSVSATGTITVTATNTVSVASSTPTLCQNTVLTAITHTTTGATGIGTPTGLPTGVTASFGSNKVTISGTSSVSGVFSYSIPLTGGCGSVDATGTITVTATNTVSVASSTPTLCQNTALTAITHTTTGATGIGTPTGLPTGVTASFASNKITISGTPSVSGVFSYSIPLTGGCGSVDATGTITVDQKPVLPSLSIDYNVETDNCWGREVTLTATGGTLYGSSEYIYGTSSGDDDVKSASTSTTATHTPSATTTTYYVGVTANGACAAQNIAVPITYKLPSNTGNALAGNNDTRTCYMSGSNPIQFYTTAGKYLGSINPQGRTGNVTMSVTTGPAMTQPSCNDINNPSFFTAYMGRITHVDGSQLNGNGLVDVILAFSDAELTALQNKAIETDKNGHDNINMTNYASTGVPLSITKVSGISNDFCDGVNNTVEYIAATGKQMLSPSIANTGYVAFSVSSFSYINIAGANTESSPLPITLKSFSGNCNNGVELTWITGSENNVSHYEIYSSTDGSAWNKETDVKANGNSSTELTYTTNVRTVEAIAYYRLRSVDNDGQYEDFSPISVACDRNENTWNLYPVPAIEQVTVTIQTDKPIKDQIILMDMNGRIVESHNINLEAGIHNINLNINTLSKGTYTVKMANQTDYKPLRVVKIQ